MPDKSVLVCEAANALNLKADYVLVGQREIIISAALPSHLIGESRAGYAAAMLQID